MKFMKLKSPILTYNIYVILHILQLCDSQCICFSWPKIVSPNLTISMSYEAGGNLVNERGLRQNRGPRDFKLKNHMQGHCLLILVNIGNIDGSFWTFKYTYFGPKKTMYRLTLAGNCKSHFDLYKKCIIHTVHQGVGIRAKHPRLSPFDFPPMQVCRSYSEKYKHYISRA